MPQVMKPNMRKVVLLQQFPKPMSNGWVISISIRFLKDVVVFGICITKEVSVIVFLIFGQISRFLISVNSGNAR